MAESIGVEHTMKGPAPGAGMAQASRASPPHLLPMTDPVAEGLLGKQGKDLNTPTYYRKG